MVHVVKALFGLALVGVLSAVGLALSSLGPVALVAYGALLAVAAVLVLRTARAVPAVDTGRTCTCCTSTVHDPVEVR